MSNPFLAGKNKPMVVGHRGVPTLHQENTLKGFRRALQLGIPAIELDVQLTKDRKAVVLHDAHLGRLTGDRHYVWQLTWDQISKLRIKKELPMGVDVHGQRTLARYESEEPIPLLAEVLAEVAGKAAVNVELKLNSRDWWSTEVARVTADVVANANAEDFVILTSFDPRKLRAASAAHPRLATGFCFDDSMLDWSAPFLDRLPHLRAKLSLPAEGHIRTNARRLLNRILESNLVGKILGSRLVGAEHTIVGSQTVKRLHDLGIAIGTHTLFPLGSTTGKPISPSAMTAAEVERLIACGVDWIETDDPVRLQALIG
ncbi:MAG TPA: glycerophosphodiester phosphodiesterase [Kofleriaceae bacterium]|nr:glycerophosphodiester phosphodiesterase [Kofleriaceae bacterium]